MRKLLILAILYVFSIASFGAKSVKVKVINTSSLPRVNEIIEVDWEVVKDKLGLGKNESIVVEDKNGKQLPYQVIYAGQKVPQSVIFPVSVEADGRNTYKIKKGLPETLQPLVHGRYVPERLDDFAWENDRIAFRMYGPALKRQRPSNGVDVWLKRTDSLIVDKWYADFKEKGRNYHVDYGQGLDCYKVGQTLGAGGIAPFFNDTLWIGKYYNTYEVLDNGPLRVTFSLSHTIPVAGKIVNEKITISLDAYSQLNKGVVSYEGGFNEMKVVAGIALHRKLGEIKTDQKAGYLAYAENAVSIKGENSGRSYTGLVFQLHMKDITQDKTHLLGIASYKKGQYFTYYFGAGWSKWGFDTDESWFEYMADFTEKVRQPLNVTIKK
ncbi:MAG: DUF4861 family protein [Labilibaculum sp.]|nr:DUF4861 family protein [Labilibaculum sp.]